MLAEAANATKKGGQELIGGLDVRVHRNHFGRQTESFEVDLSLPFLEDNAPFHAIFIRAPIVEKILPHVDGPQTLEAQDTGAVIAPSHAPKNASAAERASDHVEIMVRLPKGLGKETGDIVAVRQGNVFGTSFHPELTNDVRIHAWWLKEVMGMYLT